MAAIRVLLFAAAITAAGCTAPALVPAPGANRLSEHAATAETGGVRLVARAEAWSDEPQRLPEHLTPLLVTVINDSERAIRVAYEGFVLVGPDGRRYGALAPARMEGVLTEMVGYLPDTVPHFGAPYWPQPAYWYNPGPTLRYVRVPTVDMLRQALPEGVLEPGGEVSGFVYFERIAAGEDERFELRADFPALGAERVTRVDIPFTLG
jgi:hypothetical protein